MTQPSFTQGSIAKHILIMSSTSAIGLLAIFIVDLLDMFFLSLLGVQELAAAVGYAGTVLFFTTAICLGFGISTGTFTSKSIGARKLEQAKQEAVNMLLFGIMSSLFISLVLWFCIPIVIRQLGATDYTAELANDYLNIIIPSMPLLLIGMSCSSVLRSLGQAKNSMLIPLTGGLVNAVFDPIFIFALDMGVEGAAIASVLSRVCIACMGFYLLFMKLDFFTTTNTSYFFQNIKKYFFAVLPITLTNMATPIGNTYITVSMAEFGDEAVSGVAIISRIIPVIFAIIFASTSAVSPIIGQNFGAENKQRVKQVIFHSVNMIFIYCILLHILLMLLSDSIAQVFQAQGLTQELIFIFCNLLVVVFAFNGMSMIVNAAFNNLGKPFYATILNFVKSTLTLIPFVYFSALIWGAKGVLYGQYLGYIVIGIISIIWVYLFIERKMPSDD